MDKVELRDIGKRFYDIKIKYIYVFIINIYSSLKLNCALNITINRCWINDTNFSNLYIESVQFVITITVNLLPLQVYPCSWFTEKNKH